MLMGTSLLPLMPQDSSPRPGKCSGNTPDHCCYLEGKECRFLERGTVPGRYWACGLYRELGSWEAVHSDTRYQEHIQPFHDRHPECGGDCGGWPPAGQTCAVCGITGG